MGLISQKIIIKWQNNMKKHYIDKGYKFTKYNDEFEVKVEDLKSGSNFKVLMMCDNEDCKNPYFYRRYSKYLNNKHEDGKCYCGKCATKLVVIPKMQQTVLNKTKTFEDWCVENNRLDVLNRWDYERNTVNPSDITSGTAKKYYFKCGKYNNHISELKQINHFTNGHEGSIECDACKSFAQWCIDNGKHDIFDRWDYDLNLKTPEQVRYTSGENYYFKCPNDNHPSELKNISNFIYNNKNSMPCSMCNSFAQWGVKKYGDDFIDKYWSSKNALDPWQISWSSPNSNIWIKCQLDKNHDDYITTCNVFTRPCEHRCPLCNESKGEKKINNYLLVNSIKFERQKKFDGLMGVSGGLLSYDFYIPEKNLLIEFQGIQHTQPVDFFGKGMKFAKERFHIQQEHDHRKREYAINNNIKLLEICNTDFNKIEKILDEVLFKNKVVV